MRLTGPLFKPPAAPAPPPGPYLGPRRCSSSSNQEPLSKSHMKSNKSSQVLPNRIVSVYRVCRRTDRYSQDVLLNEVVDKALNELESLQIVTSCCNGCRNAVHLARFCGWNRTVFHWPVPTAWTVKKLKAKGERKRSSKNTNFTKDNIRSHRWLAPHCFGFFFCLSVPLTSVYGT